MLHLLENAFKIFALIILGFLIAVILSGIIGLGEITLNLLPIAWAILWRLAIGLLVFGALVAVWEGIK